VDGWISNWISVAGLAVITIIPFWRWGLRHLDHDI
jgi:hypothetical protein